MCGRYSFAVEPKEAERRFHAQFVGEYAPRYNAAPSQNLPVILNESPDKFVFVHWGLMPPWLEKLKKSDGLINVRAETLREKPTFKNDLLNRRCLIPADGFYEWKKSLAGKKIPYRFTLKDGSPFALAGIWEINQDDRGEKIKTFAIITTSANKIIEPIHNRMPVILRRESESSWLSEQLSLPKIYDILEPYSSKDMKYYEVSTIVNSAKLDSSEVINPIQS